MLWSYGLQNPELFKPRRKQVKFRFLGRPSQRVSFNRSGVGAKLSAFTLYEQRRVVLDTMLLLGCVSEASIWVL